MKFLFLLLPLIALSCLPERGNPTAASVGETMNSPLTEELRNLPAEAPPELPSERRWTPPSEVTLHVANDNPQDKRRLLYYLVTYQEQWQILGVIKHADGSRTWRFKWLGGPVPFIDPLSGEMMGSEESR